MPSKDQLLQELQTTMPTAKRLMHAHMQAMLKQYELSSAEFEVFFAVHGLEEIPSSKELADSLQLTPGAVSQLVESLSGRGYMVRQQDEQDRRIMRLSLTNTGKRVAKEIQQNKKLFLKNILSELSEEELAAMLSAQHKIISKLQKEA